MTSSRYHTRAAGTVSFRAAVRQSACMPGGHLLPTNRSQTLLFIDLTVCTGTRQDMEVCILLCRARRRPEAL
jgi:hypothetical protein